MATAERRTLSIEARLKDNLTKPIGAMERALTRFALSNVRGLKNVVNSVLSLRGAITGLAGAYIGLQGVNLVKKLAADTDEMQRLARSSGDAIENLSELEAAMRFAGARSETLVGTIKGLTSATNQAREGNDAMVDAYESLGVSMQELATLGPAQILEEMSAGLGRFNSAQEKAGVLAKILPETYLDLLPLIGEGVEKFQDSIREARAFGATVTGDQAKVAQELRKSFAQLDTAVESVGRALLESFGPNATAALRKLAEVIVDNREEIVRIAEAIGGTLVAGVNLAIKGVIGLIQTIESIPGVSLLPGRDSIEAEVARIKKALREIDEARNPKAATPVSNPFAAGLGDLGRAPSFAAAAAQQANDEFAASVAARRQQILDEMLPKEPELREKLALLETQLTQGLGGSLELVRQRLATELEATAATVAGVAAPDPDQTVRALGLPSGEDLAKYATDVRTTVGSVFRDVQAYLGSLSDKDPIEKLSQSTRTLLLELAPLAPGLERVRAELLELDRAAKEEALRKALKDGAITAEEFAAALRALQVQVQGVENTINAGFKDSLRGLESQIDNFNNTVGATFGDIVTTGVDGLANAFGDVISQTKSAEDAFKDFAKSFLSDVAKMIARLLILQAIRAASGGVGFFEDGGTTKGTVVATQGLGSFEIEGLFERGGIMPRGLRGTIPFRAFDQGGIVREPTLALFGEGTASKGEAFVPLPDGRSIPVSFVGNGTGGGGAQVMNVNITAMDSRDVARALQENQQALRRIWQNQVETRTGVRQTIQRAAY